MTKQELVAKMQEGNAWIPGKKVKLDFGSEGAVMLDGAGQSVSEDNGAADTTITRSLAHRVASSSSREGPAGGG